MGYHDSLGPLWRPDDLSESSGQSPYLLSCPLTCYGFPSPGWDKVGGVGKRLVHLRAFLRWWVTRLTISSLTSLCWLSSSTSGAVSTHANVLQPLSRPCWFFGMCVISPTPHLYCITSAYEDVFHFILILPEARSRAQNKDWVHQMP